MFFRALILSLLIMGFSMNTFASEDPSQNVYNCLIFEPSMDMVEARVSNADPVYLHELQDGIHVLEVHWWEWTLNLGIMKKGVVREVLGAASHTNLKLRSHEPDISVWCDKE